jgi:hypothetical protein
MQSSFARDLKSINSRLLPETIAKLIELVEAVPNLAAIPDVKKLVSKTCA